MTKQDELTAGLQAELDRVNARLAEQKRPQNCGTGHCSCIECVMEPATRKATRDEKVAKPGVYEVPVKTYCGGKAWPVAQPVVSLQCAHCHVTIETLNDKVMRTLAEVERLKAAQPAAHQCHWIQMDDMHMPDTWQGACGAVWTFTEGGPQDNDQAYCPKCGGVCIEVRAVEEGGAA